MKLVVLSDNQAMNGFIVRVRAWFMCFWKQNNINVCLTQGASDIFIRNAEKLAIDLSDVDYVFYFTWAY